MRDEASKLSPFLRLAMFLAGIGYFLGSSGLTSIEAFGIKVELAAGLQYPLVFVVIEAIGLLVVGLELWGVRLDRKLVEENDKTQAQETLKKGFAGVEKASSRKAGLIIGKSRVNGAKFLVFYLIPLAVSLLCVGHYAVTRAT